MGNKVAIYIPAYNAASTLTRVLERIPQNIKDSVEEIFIVDNNSTDNTHLVVVGYKHTNNMHKLEVVRNPKNMGYGGSQKIAYRRCIDRGYDFVAMLHGDAQYAPEFLEHLLQPVVAGKADMIFGSRMTGHPLQGGMPLHRFLGNRTLSWVQNKLLGTNLSEFHSGYRVFSVNALRQVPFERLSSDYHFDTEIILLLLNHNFKIMERTIPTYYGDEKNYVNIWRYALDVFITTFTYFLYVKGWHHSRRWARVLEQS